MSNADTDSEGFESADDNEFDSKAEKLKTPVKSKKAENESKAQAVADKFKALDVANASDDIEDDWGWGDEDDDNFKFESEAAPIPKETAVEKCALPAKVSEKKPKEMQRECVEDRPLSKPATPNEPPKTSSWLPWSGVTSLISSASSGVASFIESNIGIPDPEDLARKQKEEALQNPKPEDPAQVARKQEESREKLLNLGSLVSNVTEISNRVISGGLDTLEGIGKKTMTILQENDPGLINKRKLLGLDNDRPVLSQMLREAKEKSEESEKTLKLAQRKAYRKQLHFEMLFDDFHGLVHLEALEMLSKQASIKLQSLLMPLTGQALNELQQTMSAVTELCELNELDQDDTPDSLYEVAELVEKFNTSTEDFDIEMDFKDVLELVLFYWSWFLSSQRVKFMFPVLGKRISIFSAEKKNQKKKSVRKRSMTGR